MNCYIQEIIIFNRNGDKRNVIFHSGLNVITGDSKTGKSALIEIVDYCLCSKTSNIPQGVISQFAYLYSIVLNLGSKFVIIGRKSFNEDKLRVFVTVEANLRVIQNLSLSYFDDHSPMQLKDAQEQIERHLNMSVSNIAESEDADPTKKRKASLREMPAFLFQHQNLLANKHALFYHFDDYYKRQATIDSFPVFAGWVNDEYFSLKRELDSLEKDIRRIEIDKRKQEQALKEIESELKGYFKNYYRLIGQSFNDSITLNELLSLKKQLPDYSSKTFLSQDILDEYNSLKEEREKFSARLSEITKQIKDLEESERYANEFQVGLKTLDIKSNQALSNEMVYTCPTCGKITEELTQELVKLKDARLQLAQELNQLSSYAISYQKEIDQLRTIQSSIRKEIRLISRRIDEIESLHEQIRIESNISNQILYSKAQIDLRVDLLEKEKKIVIPSDFEELNDQIKLLKETLSKYNIEKYYQDAHEFFKQNLNRIANKLDFEDELKPLAFELDLRSFSFFHQDSNIGKISLNEMGSGANWLTCHLSIFLTFLRFFSNQPNSVIPSFLFLDQPSQVYFPRKFGEGDNKDNDIRQVERIYRCILEEIDLIEKSSGYLPQVIITDHADNLDLMPFDFEKYVLKRWTPLHDGALI